VVVRASKIWQFYEYFKDDWRVGKIV